MEMVDQDESFSEQYCRVEWLYNEYNHIIEEYIHHSVSQ